MTIAFTESDISRYMDVILAQHIENPVLCDKYLMGQELEVDVISDGKDVLIPVLCSTSSVRVCTAATPSPCTRRTT